MKVPVPAKVFEGIEAVRLSGRTNMLDCHRVTEIAEDLGFDQAARWVQENRDRYAQAVFHGFDVSEDQRSRPGHSEDQRDAEL